MVYSIVLCLFLQFWSLLYDISRSDSVLISICCSFLNPSLSVYVCHFLCIELLQAADSWIFVYCGLILSANLYVFSRGVNPFIGNINLKNKSWFLSFDYCLLVFYKCSVSSLHYLSLWFLLVFWDDAISSSSAFCTFSLLVNYLFSCVFMNFTSNVGLPSRFLLDWW